MYKKLLLLAVTSISVIANAQDANPKKGWYFKAGASYFIQTSATEFPIVSGQQPNTDVYAANGTTLVSRETNHGSFGAGFRTNISGAYRFTDRLGIEMGVNYFDGNSKTMVDTRNRLVAAGPTFVDGKAEGYVKALDLSPSLVLFLGEVNKFEPYTKVGVIIPVYGRLTIDTERTYTNPLGVTKAFQRDVIKPNPTVGFMAAIGTSYKISSNISIYGEVEYRNFTVHGKSKETTEYTENGVDKLNTATAFRSDASYSAIHTNYVDKLDGNSNNLTTNSSFDSTKAKDEISSYIGISGVGLSLGVKYSL